MNSVTGKSITLAGKVRGYLYTTVLSDGTVYRQFVPRYTQQQKETIMQEVINTPAPQQEETFTYEAPVPQQDNTDRVLTDQYNVYKNMFNNRNSRRNNVVPIR